MPSRARRDRLPNNGAQCFHQIAGPLGPSRRLNHHQQWNQQDHKPAREPDTIRRNQMRRLMNLFAGRRKADAYAIKLATHVVCDDTELAIQRHEETKRARMTGGDSYLRYSMPRLSPICGI